MNIFAICLWKFNENTFKNENSKTFFILQHDIVLSYPLPNTYSKKQFIACFSFASVQYQNFLHKSYTKSSWIRFLKNPLMIIPHKQLDMSWTVSSEVQSIGAWWANQETKIFILHDALPNTRSTFWNFVSLIIKYSKIHSWQSARDKKLRFVKNHYFE